MKIIASVYDYQINQDEFDYAQVLFSDCSCGESENNKKAIDYLIDKYLLLFEANKFGIEVTDEEWNEKIFDTSLRFESREQYFDYLKQHKLNRIRYEEILKESLIIDKFLDKFSSFIKDRVAQDVSDFAETNSELFSCCPQAHVYNILLLEASNENFKKLMKFRQEIETVEDFKRIADLYSECPAGVKCGDMGFVSAGTFIEELDSVIFTLPLNEVSLPVKSKFGYHLILVTERNENPNISDDVKKDFMLNCLIDDKSKLYLHSYVDELRKEASEKNKIIINI